MKQNRYPFSALVGQDALKSALLLNAVDPVIGGVLIRGHKGSGKSTAARALKALLPGIRAFDGCPYHCDPDQPDSLLDFCRHNLETSHSEVIEIDTPVVELPLGATEDRIIGTLNLESALKHGERQYEPGLLAAANRGILYVDEVNLLPDHLVDLLLDVAASGVNIVEREGMRHMHPARFILVGTMNPEEGDLRPQFLDRFGLCINVETLDDPDQRAEIIKRRIAFETDPQQFIKSYRDEEALIRETVVQARSKLETVEIPESVLNSAVDIAIAAETQGHRTEITLIRAAKALSALLDRPAVSEPEIMEAARLVLPHRIIKSPLDRPGNLNDRIEDILARKLGVRARSNQSLDSDSAAMLDNHDFPGAAAAGSMLFTYLKKKLQTGPSNRMTTSS